MDAVSIANAYVAAINAHDVARIVALMSEDHAFIDTYGNKESKQEMETGWAGYFEWFPDYLIEVEQTLHEGDTVVLLGYAGGTYRGRVQDDNKYYWRLPAVWKTVVRSGKIKIWQVYCDSKIPYGVMEEDA